MISAFMVDYEPDPHNRQGRLVWESPKGRRIYTTHLWGFGGPTAIQEDINRFLIDMESVLGLEFCNEEPEITLRIPENMAKALSRCIEFQQYMQGASDALAALNGVENPNKVYGLTPYFYGLKVEVVPKPRCFVFIQTLQEIAKNAEQLADSDLTVTFTRESLATAEAKYGPFGPEARALIDAAMEDPQPIIVEGR